MIEERLNIAHGEGRWRKGRELADGAEAMSVNAIRLFHRNMKVS